ncbi:hypothetical protein GOODEAATRI_025254, partial [Goodea atripinnis]
HQLSGGLWRSRASLGAGIGGQVERSRRGLTELKAVDAQAGICGVVEPSLFSPAACWVCVHLPCCNTCKVTIR